MLPHSGISLMDITIFLTLMGYLVGVVGAITVIFSKVKNENIKDLRTRVGILEKERAEYKQLLDNEREQSRQQHIENSKAIAKLEGNLESYKEIPLRSIAHSLEALPRIEESNVSMLEALKNSALIAKTEADNGGILVTNKEANPLSVKEIKE